MRKHLKVLDQIEIASPCDQKWEDMQGDDRARHCALCDKNVYNLENMSEDEIFELIAETNGDFCGQLYERQDGTMLLEDCPVGLRARLASAARKTRRRFLLVAAMVGSVTTSIFAFKGTDKNTDKDAPIVPPTVIEPDHDPRAGGIRVSVELVEQAKQRQQSE